VMLVMGQPVRMVRPLRRLSTSADMGLSRIRYVSPESHLEPAAAAAAEDGGSSDGYERAYPRSCQPVSCTGNKRGRAVLSAVLS
jgi:hypothetical protein